MQRHTPSLLNQTAGDESTLIAGVLPFGEPLICAQGTDLITMGDEAQCFYFVEEGTLEVSYTAQNTSIVVALIGAGSFFGEIGFFDQLTRTRGVKAVAETRLRRFAKIHLDRMAADAPPLYARFLEYVLRSVCGRFRQILADRGPLTAYAAMLSTGKEHFKGLQPLPPDLLGSSGWQQINQELEAFKARIFDVAYRLQAERGPDISPPLHQEGLAVLNDLFSKLCGAAAFIEAQEGSELLWGYVFKELFPYLVRSRIFERAYYKPKGYAGDFMTIEMIYRNQPNGDGKLGRLIDGFLLEEVPSRAVRGRRRLLHQTLDQICRQRLPGDAKIRILNLACGPSRELFDLLGEGGYSERVEALCVDIDDEALQFASLQAGAFRHGARVRFMNENVIKWAIGRIKQDFGPQDIIYSSGLCDYLEPRVITAMIRRCFDHLKPGGVLIIGNFAPTNPYRFLMDHLMYWRLIYRTSNELRGLFDGSPFGSQVEVMAEPEGVNLFAVARRPVP
ncbi:MAG: cyclic nucleotide-binding domain-containing protein [Desulfobacteraceae bacterium]|nr:cyclic nucleotide-binding domain-containing protein [Desulfobacteraceae bacterium]